MGAGGLGAPVSLYLAAAGIGTIGIVDADVVDLSNLQRQVIHTTNDIGNAFWKQVGWTRREDLNYYDFTLNEANIMAFNK